MPSGPTVSRRPMPAVLDTLGWILVAARRDRARDRAAADGEQTRAGRDADIRLHLAKALLKTGDKAGAKTELEAVAELDQASPRARRSAEDAEGALSRRARSGPRDAPTRLARRNPHVNNNTTIAVVGLGYVGLPLAVEFGKKYPTIGFDLSTAKVDAYRRYVDPTGEVSAEELRAATRLRGHDRRRSAAATPTSSSSPCRRPSTTRTSPTSARSSAPASRSAAT